MQSSYLCSLIPAVHVVALYITAEQFHVLMATLQNCLVKVREM